jgi:hypothetical protein
MDHFHQQLEGKNGGGDPWHTDGRLGVALLVTHTNKPPATSNSPATPLATIGKGPRSGGSAEMRSPTRPHCICA